MENWARNFEFGAARVHSPGTVDEVQEIVRNSERVKAVGTRHSFNKIADTSGDLISTEHLNRIVSLDKERRTVTVEAGIRYGELGRYLDVEGFALHNLASLPHISVAGACVTATHGSGVGNGSLASSVAGLKVVTADGSIASFSREENREEFEGAVVNLGGLGIVSEMTLDVQPTFVVSQYVYDNLPFAELESHFEDVMSSAYSVSLFTHWTGPTIDQVWVKRRHDVGPGQAELFGAKAATSKRSPLPNGDVENCTEQMGLAGPWYDRLPHFRMGFTPSSSEELQTEYFVPREHAWAALSAVDKIRDKVAPLLQTTEIRCIAADNFWMSPCYGRDSVAIHFTWQKNWVKVMGLLPILEEYLAGFDARPHWGKLFTLPPETLQSRYERIKDFRNLLLAYDPHGKFRNSFLEECVLCKQ